MAKEPLKLMKLKDLDKVIQQIAKLPKSAVEDAMPKPKPTKKKNAVK